MSRVMGFGRNALERWLREKQSPKTTGQVFADLFLPKNQEARDFTLRMMLVAYRLYRVPERALSQAIQRREVAAMRRDMERSLVVPKALPWRKYESRAYRERRERIERIRREKMGRSPGHYEAA